MVADSRKLPSYEVELLSNGMKQVGINSAGLPEFIYFGEDSFIVKKTEYILETESYFQQQINLMLTGINNIVNGGVNVKINSSMDGELIKFFEGQKLYSGSETFADYPTRKDYSPPPKIVSYSVEEGVIGYNLLGEPIYMNSFKGETESVTETAMYDPYPDILVGTIIGVHPNIVYQLSSKSKSNGRVINGQTFYDWSYTITKWP